MDVACHLSIPFQHFSLHAGASSSQKYDKLTLVDFIRFFVFCRTPELLPELSFQPEELLQVFLGFALPVVNLGFGTDNGRITGG